MSDRVRSRPVSSDLIDRVFEAIAKQDIDGLLVLFTEDARFEPLTGTRVESGGYSGHAGIRAYFEEMGEVWAEMIPYAREVHDCGEAAVVIGGCRVRGRGSGAESDSAMAWVYVLREGKIASHQAFGSAEDAFAAAGVSEDAA
jgi:ketosteroid isomerase-like protein